MELPPQARPLGITVVAVLMIVFGLAEVLTAFTHNFLSIISTANAPLSTYIGAGIGALYAAGGLLILTMRKRAATLAMLCLIAVVAGRVSMVLTGLYPIDSLLQIISIVVGTAIAVAFTIYIDQVGTCSGGSPRCRSSDSSAAYRPMRPPTISCRRSAWVYRRQKPPDLPVQDAANVNQIADRPDSLCAE
jgi:hypothetical protein